MARSQGARHRMNKKKSGKVTAFLAAATLTATAIQPLQHVHQPAPICCSHRPVYADPSLATLIEWGVPGSGGTTLNPSEETPSNPWLDGGIWDSIPDRKALLDKDLYPAVLGLKTKVTFSDGTTRVVTGQDSVNMGADALLAGIEADLAKDPNTVHVIDGGSQGSMVIIEMLIKAKAKGVNLSNMYISLYSNPYTKGTGFIDRFGSKEYALTTGFKGVAPSIPEGRTVLIVNHENDPMAHTFRYLYMAPLGILNAVLGWVEHGDLGAEGLDWWNPKNKVEVDGNVTTYTIKSKVVPLLLPLVAAGFVNGISKERMYELLKPLNDILDPLIKMTGTDDPGRFTAFPKFDVFVHQVVDLIKGIVIDAPKDVVKLLTGKPVFAAEPVGELTPTQQLIKDAKDREAELNGTTHSTGTATSFATSVGAPVETPKQTAADIQPEPSPAPQGSVGTPGLRVQEQVEVQEVKEETPKPSEPKLSDSSDNVHEHETPRVDSAAPAVHETSPEQEDQSTSDNDKKPRGRKKQPTTRKGDSDDSTPVRHQSQSRPSATTPHNQSDDTEDSSSQPKQTPKLKVQKHQQQTPKPAVEHENQPSSNSTTSNSSEAGSNDS